MSRCIRTRILEALALEVGHYVAQLPNVADYTHNDGTLKVFPYQFVFGDEISPRQINVNAIPFSFDQDVGGITSSSYDFEIVFMFPSKVAKFAVGTNAKTYYDDVDGLRIWLFNGGSAPNRNGRLQDPDNAGQLINNRISKWAEQLAQRTASGIEVPIVVGFETRENAQGERQ